MGFFKKLFSSEQKEAPRERNLMNIQVGDIVTYFGDDYEVTAVIDWMEEGYSWKEYKLKNRGDAYWISAEVDDGELIAGFYKVLPRYQVQTPPPKKIEHEGKEYLLEEEGSAVGMLTSKLGKQNYRCDYYEYESKDGEFFGIEVFDGETEVSVGEPLKESEINILPIS
jgi:hypothetical protein